MEILDRARVWLQLRRELAYYQAKRAQGWPGWDNKIAAIEAALRGQRRQHSPFVPYSNTRPGITPTNLGGQRRLTLDQNNPVIIVAGNPGRNRILLSVVTNATVYFSSQQTDLTQLDDTGTPIRGWPITGPSAFPVILNGYTDRLFARSSAGAQLVQVEVSEFYDSSVKGGNDDD